MFGRARVAPRAYFGRTYEPPAPSLVTTSSSVVAAVRLDTCAEGEATFVEVRSRRR